MNIAILSNGPGNYSTKRLKVVALTRGYSVSSIKSRDCYAVIDQTNPTASIQG